MEKVKGFVDFARGKAIPPVICLYIHPWEFIPVKKSYHFGEATVIPDDMITYGCGEVAIKEMNKLISMMKDEGYIFVTAKQLAEVYQ